MPRDDYEPETCKWCSDVIDDDAELRICETCAAMMCDQCGEPCEECKHGVVPVRLVPDLLHYPAIERIVVLGPREPACAVCHGPLGASNGDCCSVQCEVERAAQSVLAGMD